MLFQRQSSSADNVQVGIPMNHPTLSNNLINSNSSMAGECAEHQSPTTPQTITTIASINRLDDNEFTLMSAARETVTDVTSLINRNDRENLGIGGRGGEVSGLKSHVFHENLKCNRSSSSSETHSDRSIHCSKVSVRLTDHTKHVNHCKNVNSSNAKDLNKAPLAHLSPSSRNLVPRDGTCFVNGVGCKMGVR
jgi:hypothetical protein